MTTPAIGSQMKRDIAYVITSLLEPEQRYSKSAVEQLISDNVRPAILAIPGLAPDHIRLSMLECGFACRDEQTNELWVSPAFSQDHDHHARVLHELKVQADQQPNEEFACPTCQMHLRAGPLFWHYRKKHAGPERWEEIVEAYFGWV